MDRPDQVTDHRPMLYVHSRMVRPKSDSPSLLVKQPPGQLSPQFMKIQVKQYAIIQYVQHRKPSRRRQLLQFKARVVSGEP